MARTKIVATIGPASDNEDVLRKMLYAGMTVARVNFSHGSHESHQKTIQRLRQVAASAGKVLAILGDLQGPKIRLGNVRPGGIPLTLGDEMIFTPRRGQPNMIHLPHPELIQAVQPGGRMVIGDGEVEFEVTEKREDLLVASVTVAGLLESRKGVNVPGTFLPVATLTDKDKEDIDFICDMELDYVALSFVRSADDILELRERIAQRGKQIPIIAKIEKSEAIKNLESIRDVTNGMMVARGDLGIDMQPQEIPMLQKRIIRCCNETGIPVITATQMLQSMVEHPRPTRAEASDVANAILDGTDAVMLSGETASGKFPVEAVRMMRKISDITEEGFPYELWRQRRRQSITQDASVTEAISAASCAIAEEIDVKAIVTSTLSGYTARQIVRHRPVRRVIAVTPSPATQRRLALVWGVECKLIDDYFQDTDAMLKATVNAVKPMGFKEGDKLVITAGIPFGQSGQTNLIKVHEIERSGPH